MKRVDSCQLARMVGNAFTVLYVVAHHVVPSELSEVSSALSLAGTNIPVDPGSLLLPKHCCHPFEFVQEVISVACTGHG